jgi:hypothetical protein
MSAGGKANMRRRRSGIKLYPSKKYQISHVQRRSPTTHVFFSVGLHARFAAPVNVGNWLVEFQEGPACMRLESRFGKEIIDHNFAANFGREESMQCSQSLSASAYIMATWHSS